MLAVFERLATRLFRYRYRFLGGAIVVAAWDYAGIVLMQSRPAIATTWMLLLLASIVGIALLWGLFLLCLWFHPEVGWLRPGGASDTSLRHRARRIERGVAAGFLTAFIVLPILFVLGALVRLSS